MLERFSTPFVLVLDDVHTVVDPEALDVLDVVVANLPAGCLLVLAGRAAPPLKLGRLRVKRDMVEIGRDDLAFGPDEAITLYRELGLDLTDEPGGPARRTHRGLAGGALPGGAALTWRKGPRDGERRSRGVPTSVGAGSWSTTSATSCWTTWMPRPRRSCSAPRASSASPARCATPRCGRQGSAELLDDLERRNLLVIPLDRAARVVPPPPCAERLACASSSPDVVGPILGRSTGGRASGSGRTATPTPLSATPPRREIRRWSSRSSWPTSAATPPPGATPPSPGGWRCSTRSSSPPAPRSPAFVAFSLLQGGDGAGALHWLARAERGLPRGRKRSKETAAAADVVVALLRATVREVPAADMVADAGSARRKLPFGDWHSLSCLLLGAGEFMLGNDHDAEAVLEEGIAEASVQRASILALCLAHLAVLHVERDDWTRATSLARQGREVLADGGLEAVPNLFLVTAVSSLVEAHAGAAGRGRQRSAPDPAPARRLRARGSLGEPAGEDRPRPVQRDPGRSSRGPHRCSKRPTASSTGCPMPSA